MNRSEITTVLSELHKISGFRISLHGVGFEEIAAYPEKKLPFCSCIQRNSNEYDKCKKCDRDACTKVMSSGKTLIYRCHNGLIEAISPLYNFGALTGYLMMGQVGVDGEKTEDLHSKLMSNGQSDFEARSICAEIPYLKYEMIESYVHIMTICAQYLTLSNAVTSTAPTTGELILRYISENYTKHIEIKDICQSLGYSKSTVLSAFKREFGTTINTYLNNMRLTNARKMLEESEKTINEVAIESGFSDQSYFSKVFSSKYGMTPSEYRKGRKK